MAISRDDARSRYTAETGHEQFTETIYGVTCAACQNYILTKNGNPGSRLISAICRDGGVQ